MVKNLTVLLALSVLLTACGGSDNNNSSKSSSSVVMSSSSVAVSSSSVVVSSSSVAMTSSSVAPSSSSVVPSSSSVAPSSSSVAPSSSSVSSSSSATVACDPNPDSIIDLCAAEDPTKWVIDAGNGGSLAQGPSGPIFTVSAPTGTNSWNTAGFYFKLGDGTNTGSINALGKALTITFIADATFKATGGYLQAFIQEDFGPSYGGQYCNIFNADITAGQSQTVVCDHATGVPGNGVGGIRLGMQVVATGDPKVYSGTVEILDATFE